MTHLTRGAKIALRAKEEKNKDHFSIGLLMNFGHGKKKGWKNDCVLSIQNKIYQTLLMSCSRADNRSDLTWLGQCPSVIDIFLYCFL